MRVWVTRTKDGTFEIIKKSDIAFDASVPHGASEQSPDLSIPESLLPLDEISRPPADSLNLFQGISLPESLFYSDGITRFLREAREEHLDLSERGSSPSSDKIISAPPDSIHPGRLRRRHPRHDGDNWHDQLPNLPPRL